MFAMMCQANSVHGVPHVGLVFAGCLRGAHPLSMTKPTNLCVLCARFLGQRYHRLRCSVSVVWDTNYHAFFFLHVHLAWVVWVQFGYFQSQAKDNVLAIVLREGRQLAF